QVHLARHDRVNREPGRAGVAHAPGAVGGRVREGRAAGAGALQQIGEDVHCRRRLHMKLAVSSMDWTPLMMWSGSTHPHLDPRRLPMPVVTAGSARIPYEQRGSGPGLLLVHGTGPGAAIVWGELAERFARTHTVLLPDLSGSPAAQDDGGPLTLELLAEQLAAV